jgi:hypothetical protein
MSRALSFARIALESTGDVGIAVSISLIALHYLWWQARTPAAICPMRPPASPIIQRDRRSP